MAQIAHIAHILSSTNRFANVHALFAFTKTIGRASITSQPHIFKSALFESAEECIEIFILKFTKARKKVKYLVLEPPVLRIGFASSALCNHL